MLFVSLNLLRAILFPALFSALATEPILPPNCSARLRAATYPIFATHTEIDAKTGETLQWRPTFVIDSGAKEAPEDFLAQFGLDNSPRPPGSLTPVLSALFIFDEEMTQRAFVYHSRELVDGRYLVVRCAFVAGHEAPVMTYTDLRFAGVGTDLKKWDEAQAKPEAWALRFIDDDRWKVFKQRWHYFLVAEHETP